MTSTEPSPCSSHQAPQTPTSQTIDYYNANAKAFAGSTVDVEFSSMRERFTSLLAPGDAILDFGCGSGRDAKAFLDAGFDVTAIDGSAELCAIAQQLTGLTVRNELFQELSDIEAYDGIWACSSILHLTKVELTDVLSQMAAALRPHGIIYTSFKLGDFEGMRNGRYFTDFTESDFRAFLSAVPSLRIEQSWTTQDVRPGREDERWLNLLLRKN